MAPVESIPYFDIPDPVKEACWVWKHHKRVCGENSNPFIFPSFDDDDMAVFQRYATMAIPEGICLEELCLPRACEVVMSVPERDYLKVAPSLFQHPPQTGPMAAEEILWSARYIILMVSSLKETLWTNVFKKFDPFFLLARIEFDIYTSHPTLMEESEKHRFTSTGRHRALVVLSLIKHAVSDERPPAFDLKQVQYALAQLIREIARKKPFPSMESKLPLPCPASWPLSSLSLFLHSSFVDHLILISSTSSKPC
ncbi:hypothetical protein JCM8547_000558 [Rhodosporidiobolus lusitaniae]